ncbi:MAG: dihydroneopterin aldolase [Gammaproteobacteria bacterium]|nr:dihydroneopterin aldolase [Gammaproteobacteria bacterium]
MDQVFIRDLRIPVVVGVFAWEKRIKQEIRLDIDMGFDIRKASASDDIKDTLDYKAVSHRVDEFARESRFDLVETLAEKIAQLILDEFPVEEVSLTLNKTGAVSIARDVGVKIQRSR